jgi:hypothetical protein
MFAVETRCNSAEGKGKIYRSFASLKRTSILGLPGVPQDWLRSGIGTSAQQSRRKLEPDRVLLGMGAGLGDTN